MPVELSLSWLAGTLKEKAGEQLKAEGTELLSIDIRGEGDRLHIQMETSGKISGEIELSVTLRYSLEDDKLSLDDMELNSSGKNLISKATLWIGEKFFKNKIDRELEKIINKQYQILKETIFKETERIEMGNGLYMKAEIESMHFEDLSIEDQKLTAYVSLRGKFKVTGE